MNNTYQFLLNWDKGQAFAERMAAKLLDLDGYSEIDPQCPGGGPDGTKDILCTKDSKRYVVGCYFPTEQKEWKTISAKFRDDYKGVAKNKADGFIFVTNQKITPGERLKLAKNKPSTEIFHGERVCNALDSPKGYGICLEYLGIRLSQDEQISFLNAHLDLKQQFLVIKETLDLIKRTTTRLEGLIDSHDIGTSPRLTVLPVAGIQMSARMTLEDLHALHLACFYGSPPAKSTGHGFRKVQVWVGLPGCAIKNADFVPPSPSDVPRRVIELLEWWRLEYMNVLYAGVSEKMLAIAQFHERFLSIHPFLDGNGRLARVIASIQFRDLLNEDVAFDEIENISEYYAALQSARGEGHQALVDVLMTLRK